MKQLLTILLLLTCASAFGQLNPTKHIKKGTDTTQILLTRPPDTTLVYRDLYSYLVDTLGFGLTIVDSTRLTADSILIYYNSGSEVGRDTIRVDGGGGATSPAGADTYVQYNASGSFGAEADFYYNYTLNTLVGGDFIFCDSYYGFLDDADTYMSNVTNDTWQLYVGNELLIDATEDVQDYVKIGDGGDVDVNLNDDVFVAGDDGDVGIGTTSPTYDLDLQRAGNVTARIYNTATGSSTLRFQDLSNFSIIQGDGTDLIYNTNSSAGAHLFRHGGTAVLSTTSSSVALGNSVDLDLNTNNEIIDNNGSTGATGDVLRKQATGVAWQPQNDAGTVENNSVAQDLHQSALTQITEWTTTAEFSGDGISWDSVNDEWDITESGKYRITVNICLDNTENFERCLQFWVYNNTTPIGVPHYIAISPDYTESISFSQVLDITQPANLRVYSARGGGDATTSEIYFCSAVNGGQFIVERVNY